MEERKLETHLCVRIRRKGNEVARDDTAHTLTPVCLPGLRVGNVRVGGGGSARKEALLGITLYLQEALQRAKPSS